MSGREGEAETNECAASEKVKRKVKRQKQLFAAVTILKNMLQVTASLGYIMKGTISFIFKL